MEKPRCPYCEAAIDIERLLQGLVGYHRATRSASAPCPSCQKGLEFQVRSGQLVMGYTYAAGALHFEGLFDVGVPGLRSVEEGGRFHFLHGGKRFDVPE